MRGRRTKRELSVSESGPEKDMDREGGSVEVNIGESADSAGEPSDSGDGGISAVFKTPGSAVIKGPWGKRSSSRKEQEASEALLAVVLVVRIESVSEKDDDVDGTEQGPWRSR